MQGDGYACGGHISIAVDIREASFAGKFQLFDQGVDDSDVGLVGDYAFHVGKGNSGFCQGAFRGVGHCRNRLFEDLFSCHDDAIRSERCGGLGGLAAGLGIVEMKKIGTGSIRPPVECEDSAGTGGGLKDNRPCAISEKNTGVAVSPVDNRREAFCSDDKNISSRS